MSAALSEILDQFLYLVQETERFHSVRSAENIKAIMGTVRKMLIGIRRQVRVLSKNYIIAVVGLTNVGKSTLLNALFGQELAPRRNGPCTAVPIEFKYGNELSVDVRNFREITHPHYDCAKIEDIHEILKQLADHSGAENSQAIQRG